MEAQDDMRGLDLVLQAKIALTVLAWCIPLLLFPAGLLEWLGFVVPEPRVFLRLLGMAYAALVLGYMLGLQQLRAGVFPAQAVRVGVLSNGGACALLVLYAVRGAWSDLGAFAQVFMWGSLLGTGAITLGLVVFGLGATRAGRSQAAGARPGR